MKQKYFRFLIASSLSPCFRLSFAQPDPITIQFCRTAQARYGSNLDLLTDNLLFMRSGLSQPVINKIHRVVTILIQSFQVES
jgi:hypothetical protein